MRYADFEKRIQRMASCASESSRLRFAKDTSRLLHRSLEQAIAEELTDTERSLLLAVLASIERESFDGLRPRFEELEQSMGHDPVRAIEFSPNLTDLLCAIDNLLEYRRTNNPLCISGIALNMVNAIDYAIGGDVEEYSTNNMLGAPQMREEFERQQQMLEVS